MRTIMQYIKGGALLSFLLVTACGNTQTGKVQETASVENVIVPEFNADSAYHYVATQVAFGARVPNTPAHKACGDYLRETLEKHGAKVVVQDMQLMAFDGKSLQARNIIGSYNPEAKARILLSAHWDSRPFADEDTDTHHRTPIDGANDGASGVGVLLEIARVLGKQSPTIGVDIIFFDAEDYGYAGFTGLPYVEHSWCLGSQYWGRFPHVPDYKARFGILLDMVGAKNATFYYEGFSKRTAYTPLKKIWDVAHQLGYERYFIHETGGEITDDHVYIHQYRGIPCVDIVHLDPRSDTGFNPTWHTLQDNIENIDAETLNVVGRTVLQVIYNEK